MNTLLIVVGKTDAKFVQVGIEEYVSRLKHYIPFDIKVLPDVKNVKNLSAEQQKVAEGRLILSQIENSDLVVLLDEGGRMFTSREFAAHFVKIASSGVKRLVFIIGGPYGFSPEVYAKANSKISLSPMTFSHQMVRMIFVEQLYRAQTIIKGEPYHHD